jgi:RNA polymerase sigma-70 factor (ECF subfamily)
MATFLTNQRSVPHFLATGEKGEAMQPGSSPVPSPEELLRTAQQGKREALGQLLQNYRPYMLHIANAELPDWLQAKVGGSDVVQEAMVEALGGFQKFEGQSVVELQGWLRAILVRQVGKAARHFQGTDKRQVDREVSLPEAGSRASGLADGQLSPSGQFGKDEEVEAVQQALARLPEHYRQILIWREWEDVPFAEIARRLDKSVDAARMVWWRAVERFNQEMECKP